MCPSYHSEPSPMPALNADVTEYDKYKASRTYGAAGQKYSACVEKSLEPRNQVFGFCGRGLLNEIACDGGGQC